VAQLSFKWLHLPFASLVGNSALVDVQPLAEGGYSFGEIIPKSRWRHRSASVARDTRSELMTPEDRRAVAEPARRKLIDMQAIAVNEIARTETITRTLQATGLWATDLLAAREGRNKWASDNSDE